MRRMRVGGPQGTVRPYSPTMDVTGEQNEADKISEALDHIARSLSAMDHNLEVLVKHLISKR